MAEKFRVLYVDDEQNLLELCKVFLERTGNFIVTTSTGAPEALRMLELAKFDAIISDYQMPEMDGIEFLKVVRGRRDKTPFIIFTGKGREDVVIAALNAGADFYLQKGGEPKAQFAELAHKIQRAISYRQADIALQKSEERYRTVANFTYDWEYWVDSSNRLVYCSPSSERITGYTPEEFIHNPHLIREIVHPDEKVAFECHVDSALPTHEVHQSEFRIVRKDRNVRWIIHICQNVFSEDGTYLGRRASNRDVTDQKNAEMALRESEERFHLSFELASIGESLTAIDGKLSHVNHALCEMLGYTAEELQDTRFTEITHPDDVAESVECVRALLAGERPLFRLEKRYIRKDGAIIWADVSTMLLRDTTGKPLTFVTHIMDITERKRAEKALLQEKNLSDKLFDAPQDTVFLFEPSTGKIVRWNKRFTDVSGYNDDEIATMKAPDDFYDADDLKKANETVFRSLTENITVEVSLITKQGVHIPFEYAVSAITMADGRTLLLSIGRDVTERKKVEDTLKESEGRLHAILDSTPFPVALVDLQDNNINFWSRSALTLFGHTAPTTPEWYEMAYPDPDYRRDVIDWWKPFLEKARQSAQPVNTGEYRVTCRDGSVRICELYATFLPDKLIVTFNDITDRKRAEEALRKSERKYRNIFDNAIEGIYQVTPEGRFISANLAAACILGYESANELMASVTDIQSQIYAYPEDRDRAVRIIKETGVLKDFEVQCRHKNGSIVWVSFNAKPVRNAEGTILYHEGTSQDITDRKKAEQALQEEALRWQSTFDSTQDGICIVDADQRIITYNRTMRKIVGAQNTDDLVGQHCFEVMHQTTGPIPGCPFVRMRDSLTREQMELKIGDRWFFVTVDPILDKTRTLVGAVHNIRDITERKRVELELVSAQESLKDAHRLAHIGIWDWVLENDTVTWSEELYKIAGRDPSRPAPTYAEHPHVYTPASWDRLSSAVTRAHTTGEQYNLELELVRPDGSIRWVNAFGGVKRDGNGKVIGLHGTVQDITDRKKAEQALRKERDFTHSVIETAQAIVIILDTEGRIVHFNPYMEEISGYTLEEVKGKDWFETFLPSHTRESTRSLFRKAIGNTQTRGNVDAIITKDGRERLIEWYDTTLKGADGSIEGLLAIGQDVTERKQTEEALKESEQKFRALFEYANDAITVLGFTPDGLPSRFTLVNENACLMSGYTRKEMLSMSPKDLDDPEEWREAREFTQRIMEHGNLVFERTLVKKDGKKIPIEISTHVFNLNDQNVMLSILRDITERKRAEQALADEATKYKILIEKSRDGIVILDQNGKVYDANRRFAEMLGYSSDEIQELYVWNWDTNIERARLLEIIRTIDEAGDHFETKHYRKDGTLLDVEISTNATVFSDKKLIFCVVRDITERKRAEEALRQVNRQLNLLSSITRHDILNQLLVLKGYLELSHDDIDKPEAIREFIEKEQKAANTIEHQIRFTKDYQELGAKAPVWQNVNASINKAIAGLPMRDIHVKVDPKNPEVFADPLFEKVFYNLIDNALKYGGHDMKAIRFFSQESDTGLTLVCEDDGVGIIEADKKRIFDKGFGKNTGLGLFLSREILAITGITITENGTPGKGARFEIAVPKGEYRFIG